MVKLEKIISVEVPGYVRDIVENFGGVQLQDVSMDQFVQSPPAARAVVAQNIMIHKYNQLKRALEDGRIGRLIVYNDQPWMIPEQVLLDLDRDAAKYPVVMMVDGYHAAKLQHIKTFNYFHDEHALSHHFNFTLSQLLKDKRRPLKDFLLITVPKDPVRIAVCQYLKSCAAMSDSWLELGGQSGQRHEDKAAFIQRLNQNYPKGSYIAALESFGNGRPNFRAYEQCFCEIVLETRSSGSYHLTEKTFRPIAFGIPIVFLGNGTMHDRLLQDGYRLYDNGFYQQWHSDRPLAQRLLHLGEFLQHIKDIKDRSELQRIADHNYETFWMKRKLLYYSTMHDFVRTAFGTDNMHHVIYNLLDR
jgi:hypothetical protein